MTLPKLLRELTVEECSLVAGGVYYQQTTVDEPPPPDPSDPPPPPPGPPPPPPPTDIEAVTQSEWAAALADLEAFLSLTNDVYVGVQGADQNSYVYHPEDHSGYTPGMMEMFYFVPNIMSQPGAQFYGYLEQNMDLEVLSFDEAGIDTYMGHVGVKSEGGDTYMFTINGRTIFVEKNTSNYVSSDPDEIVVNGTTYHVTGMHFSYLDQDYSYIAPPGTGGSAPATIDHFRTPDGHIIKLGVDLDPQQETILARIIDLGVRRGESMDNIIIAVKMAFEESSFRPNASNVGHYGLFQYLPSTWTEGGNAGSPNGASVDAQIIAFYKDLAGWHTRYDAGYDRNQTMDGPSWIPRDISFEEYAKVKHQGGSSYYTFHAAEAQGWINHYNAQADVLDARIYYKPAN